jgi:hypothetical protein
MMSAEGRNKYQKWIDLATMIDAWRIFPRVFICTYIYLLYTVVIWFMALPDPNMNQAGLVSVVVGAGAAWFGLYTQSKPKMQDNTSTSNDATSTSNDATSTTTSKRSACVRCRTNLITKHIDKTVI